MSLAWNKIFRAIAKSMMQGVHEKDPLILANNNDQGSEMELLSS